MKSSDDVFENTLDDDCWKDSFDRLLMKRSLLRDLNVIKPKVRASFNNDSSVEVSRNDISVQTNPQKQTESKRQTRSISTPKLKIANGPFDCTLSPITTWRLTHFKQNQNAWESSPSGLKTIAFEDVPEFSSQSTPHLAKTRVTALSKDIPRVTVNQNEKSLHQNSRLLQPSPTSTPYLSKQILESFNNVPLITINETDNTENGGSFSELPEPRPLKADNDVILDVVLPPGKWRKSLIVWKKINYPKQEFPDKSRNNISRFSRDSRISKRKTSFALLPKRKSERELLRICKQSRVLPFEHTYSDTALRKCTKIGEGTYGEVFLNTSNKDKTVIKIIPIEGNIEVNGEPQKTFETILPEVVITNELSNLRNNRSFKTSGFVYLKNVRCVKGKYPDHLIELWDLYENTYGTENDHPKMFKNDQLFVALEIGFGGKDLEGFVFRNSEQAFSAFVQVTLSLAAAEKLLQFEHRDLHCGNILIQQTNEKHIEYTIDNRQVKIPTNGVRATIIDYTLSRMFLNNCCYYNDLSTDEELFCAKGDYQYDIYRMMRNKLRNDWEIYEPHTNVMWLHYILTKLTETSKYKNSKSKKHLIYMERLIKMKNTAMNFNSAFDLSFKLFDELF